MELKPYQQGALKAVGDFLSRAWETGDPAGAFKWALDQPQGEGLPPLRERLGRYLTPYRPLNGMENIPYCCVRIPTGGGKTRLAAETVGVAREAGMGRTYPLVLWLVTSKVIQAQTADALRNPRHFLRQGLDAAFDGAVEVWNIADFAQIRPDQLRTRACIVVGTIQSLRVTDTTGRKVYAHHEDLEPHFGPIGRTALEQVAGLERISEGPGAGTVKYSFANLLHLHRPLMIVDEAHNVVSGLSREVQARINPSAVVEFTATPQRASNTLFNASAAELKAAQMLKLPIRLQEHSSWQSAVAGAVQERAALDRLAREDRDYIRPLVLYQAEPKNREVTVEVLRKHLIDDCHVLENKIVVATGEQRELDGVNLFDRDCPVEHVITVEALKEGWDAPFAYVFCSVASIRSATAVEQLLGRVLRMPYVTRRKVAALNRSYAHVSEPSFQQAAAALRDRLVEKMGFEEDEADDILERRTEALDFGLWRRPDEALPMLDGDLPDMPGVREALAAAGVGTTALDGGRLQPSPIDLARLAAAPGPERASLVEHLEAAVGEAEGGAARAIAGYLERVRAQFPPAVRGEVMRVPALEVRLQGELGLADVDTVMEHVDWRLADQPSDVPGLVASLEETRRTFELDVRGAQVTFVSIAGDDAELPMGPVEGWTGESLVVWLDRQVRHPELSQPDIQGWLAQVVRGLLRDGAPVESLMRMKYVLARRLKTRIAELREMQRRGAAQRFLFDPGAPVAATGAHAFEFRAGMYDGVRSYAGGRRFSKHFLERVPAFDGQEGGEEEQCAAALDSLAEVRWWSRNVARHAASFWLPTSGDRFYPDFVAELTDGRRLVVEYKGEGFWTDAEPDRIAGAVWERAGGGLFLMVRQNADGLGVLGQLQRKLRG